MLEVRIGGESGLQLCEPSLEVQLVVRVRGGFGGAICVSAGEEPPQVVHAGCAADYTRVLSAGKRGEECHGEKDVGEEVNLEVAFSFVGVLYMFRERLGLGI